MSLEAYIWAANLPLSRCNGTPFRVLLQLADRADQMGYGAYPSIATIADTLECSTRTVQRALLELRASGLIRYGDQRYVAHIPADRRPTVYDVVTPALLAKEQLVEAFAERGDNYVTPSPERGDNYGPDGVTTVVAQTVLKPSYQDTHRHLTLVTAREAEDQITSVLEETTRPNTQRARATASILSKRRQDRRTNHHEQRNEPDQRTNDPRQHGDSHSIHAAQRTGGET